MALGVGSSDSSYILKSGEAKLWLLLVGVNDYQDIGLPSLRYPALDCQGLEESLIKATEGFPNKEIAVYHDFASKRAILKHIREALRKIVLHSQPNDSIMLYFSGHGMLDPTTQEAVLCFSDTNKNDLLNTGLPMQELVETLSKSSAKQQLLCLDTCHSGDMALLGSGSSRDAETSLDNGNSTLQLMSVLRQRASQSKGFCALLSCDRGQKSWEFPELGHGVFTYYLMQGLSGEAADNSGFIDADGLYKYVYRQTTQYIDKLNHQVRLINQQKLARGDSKLYPEYPLQTPKRIVEGVGELIIGYKPKKEKPKSQFRRAFVVDGLLNRDSSNKLSRLLAGAGGFEVECFHDSNKNWSDIGEEIETFIQATQELTAENDIEGIKNISTCLLYLRGCVKETEDGEGRLILGDKVYLSRSYLRKILRQAQKTQQIVILNLVSPNKVSTAQNWIEDLQCSAEYGQCLIVTQTSFDKSEVFCQTLLQSLAAANPQLGLPVAKWIIQLQTLLQEKEINLKTWFSGTQAIIDILPGGISEVFQEVEVKQKQISQKPVTKALTPLLPLHNTQNIVLTAETYNQLETLLKHSIGIIAPAILQQCIEKSADNQELIDKITEYIPLQQKAQFKHRAKAILESSHIALQPQLARSSVVLEHKQSIDNNFIKKCQRDLVYLIGPIANFIIEEILQSKPQISPTEFIFLLAQNIPDSGMAEEFKQRMMK